MLGGLWGVLKKKTSVEQVGSQVGEVDWVFWGEKKAGQQTKSEMGKVDIE